MSEGRTSVERRVLAIVAGLVVELGGRSAGRAPSLDDTLDRDLGIRSLERVELLGARMLLRSTPLGDGAGPLARHSRGARGAGCRPRGALWCRVILALNGCAIRLEGAEHLRGGGPALLVANHASHLDVVLLLAALPADFRFVATRELLSAPLVGRLIRKIGHLTVACSRA